MTIKKLETYPVAVQKEYRRIAKGPHEGAFTLLHHEGPAIENTRDVIERLDYILRSKDASEHLTRLRNIGFVPAAIWAEYDRATQPAWAEYDRATQPAWAECNNVLQTAWARHDKAGQPAWAECDKAVQAAWAEYDKAVQPARAECGKAAQPAWARLCKQIKLSSTWNGRSIFS